MKKNWESGLLKGFPTVQYTMNRCGEGGRMKDDTEDFNKIVTICAKMLGVELNHSEEKRGGDHKFLSNLKYKEERETAPITPVYSILGNASRIKTLGFFSSNESDGNTVLFFFIRKDVHLHSSL